jgi:hypothetical protein
MNSRDTTSGNRAKENLLRERGITGLTINSRQEGPKKTQRN